MYMDRPKNVRDLLRSTRELVQYPGDDHVDVGGRGTGITGTDGGDDEDDGSSNDIELYNNMASLHTRLASFKEWPKTSVISALSLAKAGFFYTRMFDRVQCFSCNGKIQDWQIGDDAFKEHKRHFPRCALVQNMQADVVEVDSACSFRQNLKQNNRTLTNTRLSTTQQKHNQTAKIVDTTMLAHHRLPPLTRTLFPQYCEASARQHTFLRWGSQQEPISPIRLVEAGFFSLGEPDHTKCFYCGGGLRSWGPNDDPWVEHAKWFPKCEWLIRKKGETFVKNVQQEFTRVPMQNPTNHSNNHNNHQHMSSGNHQNTSIARQSMKKRITLKEAMESKCVAQILEMGYDVKTVSEVVQHRLNSTGDVFASVMELFESVMKATESPSNVIDPRRLSGLHERENESSSAASSECHRDRNMSSGSDELDCGLPDKVKNTLQDLRDKTTCKICMDDDACIVFIPCGHLVTCLSCYQSLSLCPICRTKIKNHMKAYLA